MVQVPSGVPQGSVLGPCLFLMHVNNLAESLSSTVRLFADETILYLAIQSMNDSATLQEDLRKLERWSDKWQMELSTEKCKVLRVTRKRTPLIFDYSLCGRSWESIDADKYPGIAITHDLSWNTDISNVIVNKGNRTLDLLPWNLQVNSPTLKSVESSWPNIGKLFSSMVPLHKAKHWHNRNGAKTICPLRDKLLWSHSKCHWYA